MISQTKCTKKEIKIQDKKYSISCDLDTQSSDFGLIITSKIDEKIGLTKGLSKILTDLRDQRYVIHKLEEILKQRIYEIVQGYEDCNDHQELRKDQLLQLTVKNEKNVLLASQPTLCRFENEINKMTKTEEVSKSLRVYEMEEYLMDFYVNSLSSETRSIKLDIDGTADKVHGNQQLSFFNGYYHNKVFYPILVFDASNNRLASALLRPGNSGGYEDAPLILSRLIEKIKKRFPKCRITIRADAAFGCSLFLDFLDELNIKYGKISYEIGISGNNNLKKIAKPKLLKLKKQIENCKGIKYVKKYYTTNYQAESWSKKRRIIFKVEVNETKSNTRFVVTNYRKSPKETYKTYCQRGMMENWIGDFKNSINGDRLSCSDWFANQIRFYLFCFAYVLMNEIRLLMNGTEFYKMRLWNLRNKLLKVAVSIKVTSRCVRLRLPSNYPYKDYWDKIISLLV